MTPEKDAALCNKYPQLFSLRNDTGASAPIGWGIECDDGWYDMIDTLCYQIQQHVEHLQYQDSRLPEDQRSDRQVRVLQVKEKFGGLRFYVSGADDFVDGLVRMTESLSYKTCESCGARGTSRKSGWIKVLCDGCASARSTT